MKEIDKRIIKGTRKGSTQIPVRPLYKSFFKKSKYPNLSGLKYNKLSVVSPAGFNKKDILLYECKCDCGNTKFIGDTFLVRGVIKSCGCLKRGNEALDTKTKALNEIYSSYRGNAKQKNRVFELTKEQVMHLIQLNCYYCGIKPSLKRVLKLNREFYHNGIDRINTKKGYTLDNVVPCCYNCNLIKWDFTVEEFLQNVARIYEFQNKKT